MGLDFKAWEEGKESQGSVLLAILVRGGKTVLIRGDSGDSVYVFTFSSLSPTPPPLAPICCMRGKTGALGTTAITENAACLEAGGGAVCGRPSWKKLLFFPLDFILFYFSFRLEKEPFAAVLSELK